MNSWHSYPSVYNLGHRAVANLFNGPVIVQEKVDGSQFSFGVDEEGVLHVRSKGADIYVESPQKLFAKAVETVVRLKDQLHVGWTYRGEVLDRPKHNALTYERVPVGNVILFDINDSEAGYLRHTHVMAEAERLGLESVPVYMVGMVKDQAQLVEHLDRMSCLGGVKCEGVVIKPLRYDLYGVDKKVLMGKYVSEAFREIHKSSWKEGNPRGGDIIQGIVGMYATEQRWEKAIQHRRDDGLLEDDPKDIGPLLKEINLDVLKECEVDIKEALFKWAWPQISRGLVKEFPNWYKAQLLAKQFSEE